MDAQTRHYRQAIADAANAAFRETAALHERDWREWSDQDARRRYVALVRSGHAWLDARTGSVRAEVTGYRRDVRIWGYVCANVLDVASAEVGKPQPGEMITGPISSVPTQALALLTFGD